MTKREADDLMIPFVEYMLPNGKIYRELDWETIKKIAPEFYKKYVKEGVKNVQEKM